MNQHRSNPPNRRIMIFIDGGYFRKCVSKLEKDVMKLSYYLLASSLTEATNTKDYFETSPQLIKTYYYDGVPNIEQDLHWYSGEKLSKAKEKIQTKKEKQEKLLKFIEDKDFFKVRRGRSVLDGKGDFRQKGVDSLIALDMISKAYLGHYDEAVLVTGDSDFIEIVEGVQQAGVIVTGAYLYPD